MNYQNVENVVIEIRDLLKKEASGILSNLGLKTSLDKTSLLGDILFWMQFHWIQLWIWMK